MVMEIAVNGPAPLSKLRDSAPEYSKARMDTWRYVRFTPESKQHVASVRLTCAASLTHYLL